MKAPSTLLLRAMLRPQQPLCQLRSKSDWMPREKYAKITLLDKLHRRQKLAVRQERLDSELRAQQMTSLPWSQQPKPQPSTTPTGHPLSSHIQRSVSPFPYLISRTPSKNLPVYETAKNGGNRHITSIRKISGDIEGLAAAVRDALNLPEHTVDVKGRKKETVVINWTTNQVIIRGWRAAEVKKWAELSGF
ncbi:uncharacterized protein A1O9_00936 [Exophiala aquamarina CBS 119918]|uniref:Large ribosomal subunit protein mL49 n=1 Tax=Exophiala aquamarina CBS 119918 TaxID=1182545 RepID=A0A072PSV5_9EURO|nr:uncharacterized protein A1O9_00936 [Exophiala aquamarina CBS 119918]KEF62961.1 hypothetical protein A1O9_00936 [Exophiala aquamarina CBS 119918]